LDVNVFGVIAMQLQGYSWWFLRHWLLCLVCSCWGILGGYLGIASCFLRWYGWLLESC